MGGEQRGPINLKRITVHDLHPEWLDHLSQHRQKMAIQFDGEDLRPHLTQRSGERPDTGADLDHRITGTNAGEPHDASNGIGVGDEILPERPTGTQTMSLEQFGDLAMGQGHATSIPLRGEPVSRRSRPMANGR